jgi:anti-anti-sigma factor
VSDAPGATLVSLVGELGSETAPSFGIALDHLCEKGHPVMVDLEGVTRIDGLGLSVLVQAFRLLRQRHCALIIVAPPPGVRKVMYESGIEDFMPICRTLDEAGALITILKRQSTDLDTAPSRSAIPAEGGGLN